MPATMTTVLIDRDRLNRLLDVVRDAKEESERWDDWSTMSTRDALSSLEPGDLDSVAEGDGQ